MRQADIHNPLRRYRGQEFCHYCKFKAEMNAAGEKNGLSLFPWKVRHKEHAVHFTGVNLMSAI